MNGERDSFFSVRRVESEIWKDQGCLAEGRATKKSQKQRSLKESANYLENFCKTQTDRRKRKKNSFRVV